MDKELQIVKVSNAFDHAADREIFGLEFEGGHTLAYYMEKLKLPDDVAFAISLNGKIVPQAEWELTYPKEGDCATVVPVIREDSLNIIAQFIWLAVAVVVTILYPPSATWMYYAYAGAYMAGSVVINALIPPAMPTMPMTELGGVGDWTASQTYGWQGARNTQDQGLCIPQVYGTNKIGGNIISTYINNDADDKEYLNVLISLGQGTFSNIRDVVINDNTSMSYRGVDIQSSLGSNSGQVMLHFDDTRVEYPQSVKLSRDVPYEYTTINNDFDGLEIDISFPQGLYRVNEFDSSFQKRTVTYDIEISLSGTDVWRNIQYFTGTGGSERGYWSAGSWGEDSNGNTAWMEFLRGSSEITDHYEGELIYGLRPLNIPCTWRWIGVDDGVVVTENPVTHDGGFTNSKKRKSFRKTYKFDHLEYGKYLIRLTRTSRDSNNARVFDDMYFSSVREVYYDDFSYPNVALLAVRTMATDQLSGSMKVTCIVDGKKIQTWDGNSWSYETSSNPAWVTYDILTNPIYNTAEAIDRYDGVNPSRIELASFSGWAAYCDEQIDNGQGSMEARCSFNGVFDAETTVWAATQTVCAVSRACLVWNGTNIFAVVDKAEAATQLFTVGNIYQDSFKEQFLPFQERASELEIHFANKDRDYERDVVNVVDITASTTRKTNLTLIGVTTQSQAYREAFRMLNNNKYLTRTVEFDVDIDALASTVGDVIRVQHDIPQWGTAGGRIVSADANSVTIDTPVTLEAGNTYLVSVRLSGDNTVVEKTITNSPGTYTILNVDTSYGTIPQQYDVYAVGKQNLIHKPFRIVGITRSQDFKRKITAIEYNTNVFVEGLAPEIDLEYSELPYQLSSVTGLTLTENLVKRLDGTIDSILSIDYTIPYQRWFNYADIYTSINSGQSWEHAGTTSTNHHEIFNLTPLETYLVAVVRTNTTGEKSTPQNSTQGEIYILGKTAPPADVTGFSGQPSINGIKLTWDAISDIDASHYIIKWTPLTAGATWNNSIWMDETAGTTITFPAAKSGTYLIKAVDTSSIQSTNATAVITNIPSIVIYNLQEEMQEETAWIGLKVGTVKEGITLQLDSGSDFNSISGIDDVANWDREGGTSPSGYYYSKGTIDLGGVQTSRVSAELEIAGIDYEDLFDDIIDFNSIADYNGASIDGINAELQVALSQSGSDWSDYSRFTVADFSAQAYKFRLRLTCTDSNKNIDIHNLKWIVDMPDRTTASRSVTVPSGGATYSFTPNFMEVPKLQITIHSATPGDYYDLQGVSISGFTIQTKDSVGVGISRDIDYRAWGY